MTCATPWRQITGIVSGYPAPELVRTPDGEHELRLGVWVKRWRNGRHDGQDQHLLVLRAPGTNAARIYAPQIVPGLCGHAHGDWRTRRATGGKVDELVVPRLWTAIPVPEQSVPATATRQETRQ